MRVLVAGATGVIGRRLVPLLKAVGHEVVTLSRSPGADVRVDALEREPTVRAVRGSAPDAVVHLLAAVPQTVEPRRIAGRFTPANRLRVEGTRNLIEAAPKARLIVQGLARVYPPGPGPACEDTPLWPAACRAYVPVVAALAEMERQVVAAGGLVLRLGHLTGPGSAYAADGSVTRAVRAGRLPVVGDGGSVLSFTDAHDAATAIVAALDRDVSGVLNVVDDTPIRFGEWLPRYAAVLGAPKPKHVPAFVARVLMGSSGVTCLTRLRGADNTRARLLLDWRPRHGSFFGGAA